MTSSAANGAWARLKVVDATDASLVSKDLLAPGLPEMILLEDEVSLKNNTLSSYTNNNLLIDPTAYLTELYANGTCHDECIERITLLLGV